LFNDTLKILNGFWGGSGFMKKFSYLIAIISSKDNVSWGSFSTAGLVETSFFIYFPSWVDKVFDLFLG